MGSKTKLVLDLAPLLVFFLTYRFFGLLEATGAIIVTTLLCLLIAYIKEKRIAVMPLVSGIAITVLGGLTLWLNDEYFIKIKPTLVNLLFSSILLGGLCFRKSMLKYVFESAMSLTEEGWKALSRNWGLYFMGLAVLNEYIWRNYSTDFWVNFKVFGMFSLSMLFMLSQLPLIKKHWVE